MVSRARRYLSRPSSEIEELSVDGDCCARITAFIMRMKGAASGWVSVVLLAALAVLAAGQSESNCEVSDLDEFEFMVSRCVVSWLFAPSTLFFSARS